MAESIIDQQQEAINKMAESCWLNIPQDNRSNHLLCVVTRWYPARMLLEISSFLLDLAEIEVM